MELHLGTGIQRLVDIGDVAPAESRDGALQHAEVQREAHLMDLP